MTSVSLYKSTISFTLNKEEFPPLPSVYSASRSFMIQLNLVCAYEKVLQKLFPISQLNSHKSVASRKSNTWFEIPVKFNKTGSTHGISKVSSKVYLSNANCGLCKDVLKPRYIAFCNLLHKAFKVPHVKVNTLKLSPNNIGTSSLNTRR